MALGLLHVYTGEGKGKTTAALGLGIRAAGTGRRVVFAQFMKGGATGELNSLRCIPGISILRNDDDFPFYSQMSEDEKRRQRACHDSMIIKLMDAVQERNVDMVILDEITYPCQWQLVDEERLRELLEAARDKVEIVCTGRNAPEWLLNKADYITEMKEVKHPFSRGIRARRGVEY